MLEKLVIKNFAIIADAEVNFKEGMTVLTGETGAGKSLIIDSISLLLGSRAESIYIRNGCDFAYISGTFLLREKKLEEILSKYAISITETIVIERFIYQQNSKNNIKINGVLVSLQILKQVSFYLADIHIQNDTVKILSNDYYLELIDRYDHETITTLSNNYQLALFRYQSDLKKYQEITKKNDDLAKDLDKLKYVISELKSFSLKEGEDKELERTINGMKNFDKLFSHYQEAIGNLENEYFSLNNLYNAYKEINKASEIDPELNQLSESAESAYYSLEEVLKTLKNNLRSLEYDPKVLDQALTRQNELNSLEKKYRKSLPELIIYLEESEEQVSRFENFDFYVAELKASVHKRYKDVSENAKKLSMKRKETARLLEGMLKDECRFLDLSNALFKIQFNEVELNDCFDGSKFQEHGIDSIDILLSLNAGEGMKPLNKSASGGEAARIMMAFKAVFIKRFRFSLIVFDEIDQGLSGLQALKMALKMQELSEYAMLITISHLPQVASVAAHQINIFKYEEKGRTFSNFSYLNEEDRIFEIAKMISGEKVTPAAINNAKEMLNWRKMTKKMSNLE
ncbi:MAG: DNA repair protein RecN [Erysipelotrichales bacterium]|nr:DNA repair protein RecN [Erysipelotrichales bacterium]